MTEEELDRIKKAYRSGLKVQIWFNGYWRDFDIQDYSMYSEPFSERRQYRIVGSDYADTAEKQIAKLEEEKAELKKQLGMSNKVYNDNLDYSHHIEGQLTKAKEIILKLYNAGRDVLMCRTEEKAYDNLDEAINDKSIEQFLKEVSE